MTRLPQELFRPIIYATMDQKIEDVLALRRVCKAWDDEVLRAMAQHKLLSRTSTCYRTVPWHQCMDIWAVEESEIDFLVTYVLKNPPRNDEPWNANLLAMLYRIVDEVMGDAGVPLDDEVTRRRYLRKLAEFKMKYDEYLPASREWKHHNINYKLLGGCLFTNLDASGESILQNCDFNFQTAIAKFLLGTSEQLPEFRFQYFSGSWFPYVNTLEVAIKMGRKDVMQRLDDIPNGMKGSHRLLHAASEVGDIELVKAVVKFSGYHARGVGLDPFWYSAADMESIEAAMVMALRNNAPDVFWYLLEVRGPIDTSVRGGVLRHAGTREACYQGNMDMLCFLLEDGQTVPDGQEWNDLECCVTPLEIAARAGRLDMVQLLLSHGANPSGKGNRKRVPSASSWHALRRPRNWVPAHKYDFNRICRSAGAMFGAAVGGHIAVADALLAAGISMHLSQVEWEKVALGAIELQQTEFLRWMLEKGLLLEYSGSSKYDPMAYACVWGSPTTVELFATRAFPIVRDGVFHVQGIEHDTLVQVAMNWSRPDILEKLLSLGLQSADPFQSRFREEWEEGFFPRMPKVHPLKREVGMAKVFRG